MIPKKMFFFWCSNSMSFIRYLSVYSFCKLNPDYEVTVYWSKQTTTHTPSGRLQDYLTYSGPNYWDKLDQISGLAIREFKMDDPIFDTMNPVFKSDLARWKILSDEGGFYADTDILFIKPMSCYFTEAKLMHDAVFCFYDTHCLIGFLACSQNNSFFRSLFELAKKKYDPRKYQCMGAESIMRLIGVSKKEKELKVMQTLKKRFPELNVLNIGRIVYPIKYTEQDRLFSEPTDWSSVGIHWFGGMPLTARLNEITESNINENTLIGHYIRSVYP